MGPYPLPPLPHCYQDQYQDQDQYQYQDQSHLLRPCLYAKPTLVEEVEVGVYLKICMAFAH